MRKKAACYCRVSTKKEDQLESLEKQKEFFNSYFSSNSQYELFDIYVDEGISGKSLKNRKAFDRMLSDARKGYFDAILVKDISRFARNTVDLLNSIRMLKEYNVKVMFITNNMDTFENSEFILALFGALAQEESENMSKRIKFSKNMTARQGRVPNFVFGYDRKDRFTLVPNEYEASWVRKIFELYVYEGMGTAKIAEYLNRVNVTTKRKISTGWTQHAITALLRNELYIGRVINKKSEITDFKTGKRKQLDRRDWIIVERPEFRIIEDDLFYKAQKLLDSRKDCFRPGQKRHSNKYPLSNLIVCANDGYSFRRCSRKYCENGKVYTWWTCSYRNAKGASMCSNRTRIDEDQMHRAIIDFFRNICGNKEGIAKQVGDLVSKELQRRYESYFNQKELLSELKALESKRSRLIDLYADGNISKDCLNDKLRPISIRVEEINKALDVYRSCENIGTDIEKLAAGFINKIESKAGSLIGNAFLKTIFEKFVVHEDGRVTAMIKIDDDAGLSMDIPFCEIMDDSVESAVPVCHNRT